MLTREQNGAIFGPSFRVFRFIGLPSLFLLTRIPVPMSLRPKQKSGVWPPRNAFVEPGGGSSDKVDHLVRQLVSGCGVGAKRYEPNDSPRIQIVAFLRSLFGDQVLTHPIVKSTAVSDARLTKQTLYEAGQRIFPAGHTIARWKPSTRSIMKSKS
jgi:hypothetical protein